MSVAISAPTPSPWDPSSSFAAFYEQVFRPSAAWHVSDYRLRVYDQAVARLVHHFGGNPPRLGEVSQETIDELLAATLDNRSSSWRNQIASCIRRIIRAWNPTAIAKNRAPETVPGTVRDFFESTYVVERLTGGSHFTVVEYRIVLKKLNEFLGVDATFEHLTDSLISQFFKASLERGCSVPTVNKYRAHLFAIWRSAHELGLVNCTPRVRKLREPKNIPTAWTLPQFRALFEAASDFKPTSWYGPVPCNLWWRAAIYIAYETAIRMSSLLAIRPAHFDIEAGTLYVPGQNMKDLEGQDYQLSKGAIQAITEMISPPRDFAFRVDQSVTERTFSNRIHRHFRQILENAKLPIESGKGPNRFHKIRRTSATQIAIAMTPAHASKHLGHSTEYVTDRYIDRRQLPKRDAGSQLPTPEGPSMQGLDSDAGAA